MQNDMLNDICHVVNKIFLVANLESRVTQSRGKIIGKTTYNDIISPQHFTCSYYVYNITRKHGNVFIMSLKNEGVAMEICKVVVMSRHYSDVLIGAMVPQITSITFVYSTVYSGADQRKQQSSALLAFVRGIHRWPANSPHKWPVTRKMFPFDDVIMIRQLPCCVMLFWTHSKCRSLFILYIILHTN